MRLIFVSRCPALRDWCRAKDPALQLALETAPKDSRREILNQLDRHRPLCITLFISNTHAAGSGDSGITPGVCAGILRLVRSQVLEEQSQPGQRLAPRRDS